MASRPVMLKSSSSRWGPASLVSPLGDYRQFRRDATHHVLLRGSSVLTLEVTNIPVLLQRSRAMPEAARLGAHAGDMSTKRE